MRIKIPECIKVQALLANGNEQEILAGFGDGKVHIISIVALHILTELTAVGNGGRIHDFGFGEYQSVRGVGRVHRFVEWLVDIFLIIHVHDGDGSGFADDMYPRKRTAEGIGHIEIDIPGYKGRGAFAACLIYKKG